MDENQIAVKLEINNRNFVVTVDKKIFEKDKAGKYIECSKNDDDVEKISKHLKTPRSLDII